ncbi:MAG: hypothetical protein ABII79_13225 [bacterium]
MKYSFNRILVLALLVGSLTAISTQTGYTQIVDVYIDPGHGGPGADQFHNGGGFNDNRGAKWR